MDYRAVPPDTLREFARDASERTSLRQVASEVGVGRTTLQNFIQGETSPHPRVKRLIALWYLREQARIEVQADAEGYTRALEILTDALPEDRRNDAWTTIVEIVERVHALLGVSIPPGLAELRVRLAEERAQATSGA